MKENTLKKEDGFTLVFSIFLSTIVLTITISMMNVLYKQLVLSTVDRESQVAFFAADTGMECAEYWDFRSDLNGSATSSAFINANLGSLPSDLSCAGQNIRTTVGSAGETAFYFEPSAETTTFYLNNIGGGNACATVTVTKNSFLNKTKIESRGHNRCLASDPRRVERAIDFTY